MKIFLTLLCLWFGLLTIPVAGATPQEILQQALAAYAEAQANTNRDQRLASFQQAERLFQSLLGQVQGNPDLYANLGTAALQAEHLGPAILAFRRALRLDPGHPRAAQNLQQARSLLPTWVPQPEHEGIWDSFFFWHKNLSLAERQALAALAFLLTALGVAAATLRPSTLARNLAILPGLAWLGLVISLVVQADPTTHQGVVVAKETVARAADSNNAPPRFAQPLPGGTEVDILEKRQHWVKIGLANGRDAWVWETAVDWVNPDHVVEKTVE